MFCRKRPSGANAFKRQPVKGAYEVFGLDESRASDFKARKVFWGIDDEDIVDCNRIKEEALPPRILNIPSNSVIIEFLGNKHEEEFLAID